MIKVRSVREHTNLYGDTPKKAPGTEYELPDNLVATLSAAGLVEKIGKVEASEDAGKGAKAK